MTKREENFIIQTNAIVDRLTELEQEQDINILEISNLWLDLSNLWKTAQRENEAKKPRLQNQYKKVVYVFKRFENIIRVFKELPSDESQQKEVFK